MKKVVSKILKFFAKVAVDRHDPIVIGITGSVGKSSTRHAIAFLLSKRFRVSKVIKNYNNEIGYPLSILGLNSSGKNLFAWVWILLKGFWIAFFGRKFPEVLVLELGAGKPGDIEYLASTVTFDIVILTAISPTHLEFFGSIKRVAKEKAMILKYLKKGGRVVYNFDDDELKNIVDVQRMDKVSYGFQKGADTQIVSGKEPLFHLDEQGNFCESSFKIETQGTFMPVKLDYIIGKAQIYGVLAAFAVGNIFNINLIEIAERMKKLKPLPGRVQLLAGVKRTTIIDDSYNASPVSVLSALETLGKFQNRRKIAVLGDMLELGNFTEEGHRQIGEKVAGVADLLFLVGEKIVFTEEAAKKAGMKDNQIFRFANVNEVATRLRHPMGDYGVAREVERNMREGDVVLVKGSQGVRMEKIIEEIMAEPERAKELLVRQGSGWKNR